MSKYICFVIAPGRGKNNLSIDFILWFRSAYHQSLAALAIRAERELRHPVLRRPSMTYRNAAQTLTPPPITENTQAKQLRAVRIFTGISHPPGKTRSMKYPFALLCCVLYLRCTPKPATAGIATDTLRVDSITEHTYRHLTFLDTESFGKVPCNGLIVVDDGEAVIFDTPATDAASTELIDYVETKLNAKVKAVVATHFHDDCTGGLEAFHGRGIASYGLKETLRRAREEGNPVPEMAFDDRLSLTAGNTEIEVIYPGPGHTPDNVVAYVPSERVLFGGCLIKELNAGKGNLADADTTRWSATVANVSNLFPDVRHVVPGHGDIGGPELLAYTKTLFSPK